MPTLGQRSRDPVEAPAFRAHVRRPQPYPARSPRLAEGADVQDVVVEHASRQREDRASALCGTAFLALVEPERYLPFGNKDLRIGEHRPPVRRLESCDVVGTKVRHHDQIDIFGSKASEPHYLDQMAHGRIALLRAVGGVEYACQLL